MTRITNTDREKRERERWLLTRERILMGCGLLLVFAEFVHAELLGGTFHYEFLIGGLALCGISITQWGDRGSK